MIREDSPQVLNSLNSNISYFVEGNKHMETSLFFLNGMFKGKESWIKQIRKLRKEYKMLFMDYPGFGGTVLPENYSDYMNLVMNNIGTIMEKENEEKVNLIGYSLGGAFACRFASLYPEKIKTLILINSGFYISAYTKVIVRQTLKLLSLSDDLSMIYPYVFAWHFSEDYLQKIIDFGDDMKSPNEYIRNKKALSDMLCITELLDSYKDCVEKIKCPVFVLGGDQDLVFPFERQQRLFQNKERFETKVLSKVSHSAISENFQEVNDCLEVFLHRYNTLFSWKE